VVILGRAAAAAATAVVISALVVATALTVYLFRASSSPISGAFGHQLCPAQ